MNDVPIAVFDTSFLADLSRRMLWTYAALVQYWKAGSPTVIVPDGVLREYDRLMERKDEFGVKIATPFFGSEQQQPEILGSKELEQEIITMWREHCPKGSDPYRSLSRVDRAIMEMAIVNAANGTKVYVASGDGDITKTLEAYINKTGLPIIVLKPTVLPNNMDEAQIDLVITGELLADLPKIVRSEAYNYYLRAAEGVRFHGGYNADIAFGVERTDPYRRPGPIQGTKLVRIIAGGKNGTTLAKLYRGTKTAPDGLVAISYQNPGELSVYRKTTGTVSQNSQRENGNGPARHLMPEIKPGLEINYKQANWARVDTPFLEMYSRITLHILEELKRAA